MRLAEADGDGCKMLLSAFASRFTGWGGLADARRRFSHDELGLKPDVLGVGFIGRLDAFDQKFRCGGSHLKEGLAYGCESGVEVIGDDDVVEADDGDVVRAGESSVLNGADSADGGGVVEAEESSEVAGAREEIAHGRITELGRPDIFFKEDAEFGTDDKADLLRDGNDGLPTGL